VYQFLAKKQSLDRRPRHMLALGMRSHYLREQESKEQQK